MSLKICALASGSKGNCCYASDGRTHLLIDLGISATRAENCLKVLGVDPDRVVVLITHSHSDHVNGLRIFCKKHPSARVVCQRESYHAVRAAGAEPIVATREFTVGTMFVTALPASHDVPCFGYLLADGDGSDGKKVNRVAVATDLGKTDTAMLSALADCGLVMIECNHDMQMLRDNPNYTPALKARIASPHGHLSNADCAAACAFLASGGVKSFILAHISEENNTPELAVSAVKRALSDAGAGGAEVIAAAQNSMTGLFEVC